MDGEPIPATGLWRTGPGLHRVARQKEFQNRCGATGCKGKERFKIYGGTGQQGEAAWAATPSTTVTPGGLGHLWHVLRLTSAPMANPL